MTSRMLGHLATVALSTVIGLQGATASARSPNVVGKISSGGIFGPPQSYPTGSLPFSLAIGDLTGDGVPDLAVASSAEDTVSVLPGVGDGSFAPRRNYYVGGSNPAAVTIADFDANGSMDLAVASDGGSTGGRAAIFLGDGVGGFRARADYPTTGATSLAVGDLTGDGKPDIVASGPTGTVSVLIGNGDGSFPALATYPVGLSQGTPFSCALADFNGDGNLDAVTANQEDYGVSVLLNSGLGFLQTALNYNTGANLCVATGDFNDDGKQDVVAAPYQLSGALPLIGDGRGFFSIGTKSDVGTEPRSIAPGDFNGDGLLDIAVANVQSNTVSILLGHGDGTFAAKTDYTVNPGPFAVTTADLNGDGRLDLAVTSAYSNTVSVLLNTGSVLAAAPPGAQSPRPEMVSVHPNPFQGRLTADVNGRVGERISVRIYDVAGRLVRDLGEVQGRVGSGTPLTWDGREGSGVLAGVGVYFVVAAGGGLERSARVVLVR